MACGHDGDAFRLRMAGSGGAAAVNARLRRKGEGRAATVEKVRAIWRLHRRLPPLRVTPPSAWQNSIAAAALCRGSGNRCIALYLRRESSPSQTAAALPSEHPAPMSLFGRAGVVEQQAGVHDHARHLIVESLRIQLARNAEARGSCRMASNDFAAARRFPGRYPNAAVQALDCRAATTELMVRNHSNAVVLLV